ncbi:MAG: 1-acyl-sn-glycerol-3-phosphate acyltransferase [Deltaproteobacteria bacterium]|nr:1-acyl-sn-glycerol-3-phosphate acyltransferase [Deltaproteobacteria bacterium]
MNKTQFDKAGLVRRFGEPLPFDAPAYQTPEQGGGWFSSRLPSLGFYPRMIKVVIHAGRLAKRGLYSGGEFVKSSLDTMRGLEACGVKLQLSNLAVVPRLETPAVFVSNHMSTMETYILPSLIQYYRDVTFVIKDSLLRYPYFGDILRARNPIVVGRKDARADLQAVLDGGCARLAAGTSIVVFPQGSRYSGWDPAKFNSIGVKLARRAKVPLVPVALRSDAWGNSRYFLKDFGKIRPELRTFFKFGEPMEVKGNGKEEHAAVLKFIGDNLKGWGVECRNA